MKTSSAGSATLGDTSWNLPDSQLCLKSKTEPEWHRTKLGGGDTAHTLLMRVIIRVGTPNNIERLEGGTLQINTLLMRGTIGVRTPHNIERKSLAVSGWVGAQCAGAG